MAGGPLQTRRVEFPNARGHRLRGSLEQPSGRDAVAFALFAHCFTCNSDYRLVRLIARELAGQGIAVLRFDFTGLGSSGGRFEDSNFTTNIEDIEAAAHWLEEELSVPPRLLIGHSLGGGAVLAAAGRLPAVRAVATINAPSRADHVLGHLEGAVAEAARHGVGEAEIGGQRYTITQQLIDDLRAADLDAAIRALDAALLVLHAPLDRTVGIAHAGRIFELARHPKSFIVLDGADHLLGRERDARYAARIIRTWASAYLDPA